MEGGGERLQRGGNYTLGYFGIHNDPEADSVKKGNVNEMIGGKTERSNEEEENKRAAISAT